MASLVKNIRCMPGRKEYLPRSLLAQHCHNCAGRSEAEVIIQIR